MFAYCLNNPVVFVDSSGNAAHIGFSHDGQPHYAPWKIGSPGGGGWSQDIHYHKQDYGSVADKFYTVKALKYVFNTDEQVVLDAEHFAFYKGAFVLKLDLLDDAGFSIILIGLGPNVDAQTVRHEYGHFLHLQLTGIKNYIPKVARPSLIDFWSGLGYEFYFSEPQEYIADILGQVTRTHNGQPYHYTITDGEAFLYFIYSLIP